MSTPQAEFEHAFPEIDWARTHTLDRAATGIDTIVNTRIAKKSYVYWAVRHCDNWRIRDQLDVASY